MSTLQNSKKKSLASVLLQIPMWIVSVVGIWMLLKNLIYSFSAVTVTSDGIKLKFIGLENFVELLTLEPYTPALISKTITNLIIAFLFSIGTIVAALFISKLNSIFGMITISVLSLCSLSAWFVAFPSYAFSASSSGYVNSVYLTIGVLEAPVDWFSTSGNSINLIFAILAIMAPLFLITYFFAKRGKKTVGVMVAVCALPILIVTTEGLGSNALDLVAYMQMKAYSGQYDIPAAGIVIASVLYVVWCVVLCLVIFGVSRLAKLIKLPQKFIKVAGYILFALTAFNSLFYLLPYFTLLANNAFKPIDEFLIIPQSYFVKRPTLAGFERIFEFYGDHLSEHIGQNVLGFFLVSLICVLAVAPSSVGLAILKNKKLKTVLVLCFLPLLGFIPFIHLFYKDVSIMVSSFLSGVGFLIVFMTIYALTKLTIASKNLKIMKVIFSVICAMSTIFFVAISTVNFNMNIVSNYLQYQEVLGSMYGATTTIDYATAFAGDLLLFVVTVALAVVPAILFLVVYILSKKKEKQI